MKRLFYFLTMLSILMFACSIPSNPSQPTTIQPPAVTNPPETTIPLVETNTTEVTNTLEVTNTATVTITKAFVPVANVTCNMLTFYLDPATASGYHCETIPESSGGMEISPQYTKLTLQG